jgi:hypothetical protein
MTTYLHRDESWSHLKWGIKVAAAAIALATAVLLAQDAIPSSSIPSASSKPVAAAATAVQPLVSAGHLAARQQGSR